MNTYTVCKLQGAPDWACVPAVELKNHLWSDVRAISAQAQLCWDEDNLYVRLQATEPDILCRFDGLCDPVYQDSCLEFFFSPKEGDSRYFNFEGNPNGAMYIGFGAMGENRCRLHIPNVRELFQICPFSTSDGWGLTYRIPVRFIQIFEPNFHLHPGLQLRANFYKCGDETKQPHFIAWNPIDLPSPSFHQPDFFGCIVFC